MHATIVLPCVKDCDVTKQTLSRPVTLRSSGTVSKNAVTAYARVRTRGGFSLLVVVCSSPLSKLFQSTDLRCLPSIIEKSKEAQYFGAVLFFRRRERPLPHIAGVVGGSKFQVPKCASACIGSAPFGESCLLTQLGRDRELPEWHAELGRGPGLEPLLN